MRPAKDQLNRAVLRALAAIGVGVGVMPNQVKAATQEYFDVNGSAAGYGIVSGSTYSWDDANWANGTSGGGAATSNWVNDGTGFARFYGGSSGDSYTVTVGQDEQNVGFYMAAGGVNLTINQSSPSGDLDVISGGTPAYQGFIVDYSLGTGVVTINAPVVGAGGVELEGLGQLALYGSNSYTGGTETTGGQILRYNNKNSFGTASINFTGGGDAVVNDGPDGTTIANDVYFQDPNQAVNFANNTPSGGAPGSIWTGNWNLPSSGMTTLNTGQVGDVMKISGSITGTSGITIGNLGTMIFTGSNSYTGGTTIQSGELVISNDNNVGGASNTITIQGGVLGIAGTTLHNIDSHSPTLSGGGFDIQDPTNTFTYTGDIGGFSGFTKLGAGTLVLSGNADFSGTSAVEAGTAVIKGDSLAQTIIGGGGQGADVHGKIIFDYSTMSSNPANQIQSELTNAYKNENPSFSNTNDAFFVSGTPDPAKGLGWRDDGTSTVAVMYTYYGDANLDGIVNALDFNALATNYGKNPGSDVWAQGDFNYDGSVDSNDFDILAGNFGQDLGISGAALPDAAAVLGAVVPEPSTVALLALGGAALWTRRRRR